MRYFIVIALTVGTITTAFACDVCGCSAGGGYFGILPRFGKHFAGVRYQHRVFASTHPSEGNETASSSHERFRTAEIWGRFVPHHRVQVFALAPVHFFERKEDGAFTHVKGLGDATLIVNWMVFNTGDSLNSSWKHALQVGGGIKLPTGKHLVVQEGLLLNPNIQPGTGTYDIPLNAIYTVRHKKIGLNAEVQYRRNGANKNRYHFGNRTTAAMQFFYWKNLKKITLLPQAGLIGDIAKADYNNEVVQEYSGGSALYAALGINIYYQRLMLGIHVNQPIYQNLGKGNVRAFTAGNVSASYLF